jgi:hypothetical protein
MTTSRRLRLAPLVAALTVLAVYVSPSLASGSAASSPSTAAGEAEAQAISECNFGQLCAWSNGNFTGQRSVWAELPEPACHSHTNNTPLYSFVNKTNFTVRLDGQGTVEPMGHVTTPFGVYGELCW